ncbi:MAG: hypothetical protein ABIP94_15950 [Planctomycetota bacterium]
MQTPIFPACLLAALAAAACTGPSLHIDNPDAHRVFIDGVEQTTPELKFRYYGTTRWDAQPAPEDGRPDWSLQPASELVAVPEPASPWLFPLDFPLELLRRAVRGREDTTAAIALPATPPEQLLSAEAAPSLLQVTERALQARISR